MKYYLMPEPILQMLDEKMLQEVASSFRSAMIEESEKTLRESWYELENQFFRYVEQGDLDGLLSSYSKIQPAMRAGFNVADPLLQTRYYAVCSITLLARAAIRGGLLENESFCLSDIYIQKSAELQTPKEMMRLVATAVLDYTTRVNRIKTTPRYSRAVSFCCNYIVEHIHTHISLEELSTVTHLSKEHLSRQFKKETGRTIHAYALEKKMEAAAYLLSNSKDSVQDVSTFLGFSSHGRFSGYFKERFGETPKEYRNHA